MENAQEVVLGQVFPSPKTPNGKRKVPLTIEEKAQVNTAKRVRVQQAKQDTIKQIGQRLT